MEEIVKLNIKKWGINGEGIGFKDRKPVFVKGAIPEELVDVKIEKRFVCKINTQ